MQKGNAGYIRRRTLRIKSPGSMRIGRPKRRLMNVVRKNMQVVSVIEENAEDRVRLRRVIHHSYH